MTGPDLTFSVKDRIVPLLVETFFFGAVTFPNL